MEQQVGLAALVPVGAAAVGRVAVADQRLQRGQVGLGEARGHVGGQLGLDHAPQRVQHRDVDRLEVQEVRHRLQALLVRGLRERGAAVGAGADRDQPLHLQRGQRLAHRAARHAELLDQLFLLRQLVADLLLGLHDPALDVVDHLVGTLHALVARERRLGLGRGHLRFGYL
ncbi:hypothetical protein D9M69_500500 [compost metagenome]